MRPSPRNASSGRRMESVAAIETDPPAPLKGERITPEARLPPGFALSGLPLPGDEEELLSVHLVPRDEGSPLRPRDEIDELRRQIILYMGVLLRVDGDDPVRVPESSIS